MEEKKSTEEIIFNIFRQSLEAFEVYQKELSERKKIQKPKTNDPPIPLEEKD